MLDLETLAETAARLGPVLDTSVATFEIGGRRFGGYPESDLMGVVNLSADSWYRESVCLTAEAAIRRGLRLATEGAAVVDLGAESTLLDAERVDGGSQQSMLLPVVEALSAEGVLVSVETYLPEVAESALKAGAKVLNLTAAAGTQAFFDLAAAYEAGIILCYVQGGEHVRAVGDFDLADDHSAVLYDYFAPQVEAAEKAGVSRIWVDAGLGFYYRNLQDSAMRVGYQIRTFLEGARLRTLGWPVCQALPHAFEYFEEEVRCAEPFFAVLASLGRTDLIRTHEVARVRGVLETLAAYSAAPVKPSPDRPS